MVVTLGQQYNIGEKPTVICTLTLIAMQGHQKNSEDKTVHHQTIKTIIFFVTLLAISNKIR